MLNLIEFLYKTVLLLKNYKMKLLPFLIVFMWSCQTKTPLKTSVSNLEPTTMNTEKDREIAIFAGGCFWCTEAVFTNLKGVEKVTSGYIGGTTENPTYKEVCSGTTNHAEAIKILYNPSEIAYEDLLEIFFATHDPTTLNRQGADVGTQYRSEIFYTTETQKEKAERYMQLLEKEKLYANSIVTKISEATIFYNAEAYHQDYYSNNSNQGFCQMVIAPKLEKLRKYYASKLK